MIQYKIELSNLLRCYRTMFDRSLFISIFSQYLSNKIIFSDETVPKDKPLSFLTSLSLESPSDCCHPDALKYVKNFSKTKDELLQRLFLMFNKEAFDNQLPADMLVLWNTRLTRSAGVCVQRKIRFVLSMLESFYTGRGSINRHSYRSTLNPNF